MKRTFRLKNRNNQMVEMESGPSSGETPIQLDPSNPDIETRLDFLQQKLADCSDVVTHTFLAGPQRKCALIYLHGMVDVKMLQKDILQSILAIRARNASAFTHAIFVNKQLPVSDYRVIPTTEGISSILEGNVLLLIDGESQALEFPISSVKKRQISEPPNELTVRGPREAFIESADDNLTLLRKRLKTSDFKTETMRIGTKTQTKVLILYIKGVCKEELVQDIKGVLEKIEIDSVLGSSYLEEFLDSAPFSPFPQVQYTERPDVMSAGLLEGRVGIIVDGSPITLIVPVTLPMLLQSAEDYFQRHVASTWIRWIRYLFAFSSLVLPSFYIAITTFHPEMIPQKLLITIAGSREVVPFPALIEAMIMEISFEALREAAIRIPKPIGQAVSIIGALVIGTAAVQAGIVSAAMVIIVSFTGIASFIIPHFDLGLAFRLLRFPIMIFAGLFGLFGIICTMIFLYIHLINLRPFGVPYLTPMTPFVWSDFKDTLIRAPWWLMIKRPVQFGPNRVRQKYYRARIPKEDGD